MKINIESNRVFLFISMFLITLSNSSYLENIGYDSIVRYAGLGIVLYGIFSKTLKHLIKYKRDLLFFLLILFLFCFGIFEQNLPLSKMVYLAVSMVILASIAILPCGFLRKYSDFRVIGLGIFCGIVFNCFLAIITGMPVTTKASEGILVNLGINAGFVHRNYFSYTVIASFIAVYINYKFGSRNDKDKILMAFEVVLLLLTNSRSSYMIFLIFIFIASFNRIRASKYYKVIARGIVAVTACILAVTIYKFITTYSETFFFRTNGLNNYLKVYGNDWYHLLFGNAEMAFRDTGMGYDENIKSVIGWNGSTELVLLNVLIKNGLLGLAGYFFIFIRYTKKLKKEKNPNINKLIMALIVSFAVSAFVESYVANINYVYTVAIYLIIVALENIAFEKSRYRAV